MKTKTQFYFFLQVLKRKYMYVLQVGNQFLIIIWLSKVLENDAIESNPVIVHILDSSQFILTKQQRQPGHIMQKKRDFQKS